MSRVDAYFARLQGTLNGVVSILREKGIHERHLSFGGKGAVPTRKPTVPTDARSEFLANRAMGDWAERLLADAIIHACPEWRVSKYPATNSSMRAVRSSSASFSKSESLRVNSPASALLNFCIPGQGMSSTSFGSSLFKPSP